VTDLRERVSLSVLAGAPAELADLQRVLEAAPGYAHRVTGVPPGAADAQSEYAMLPEGKTYDDKFVLGVHLDARMVGCADVVRGYPAPDVAFLGLLLIAEPFQHRGIGRAAYQQVESFVRGFGTCRRIRLSVVRANDHVAPFWEKMGFRRTGETKPYRYANVVSEHVLFEKALEPDRPGSAPDGARHEG
jgi:GNAT superfamily N-acetyltransferase